MPNQTLPPYDEAVEKAWSAWLDSFIERLRPIAAKAKPSPFYWLESKGEPRCSRHGGITYDPTMSNEDSQRYCEKCGRILEHFFTDWGAREELGYSADEKARVPIGPKEAFTLLNVIDADVPRRTERWKDFDYQSEYRPLLRKIAKRLPR